MLPPPSGTNFIARLDKNGDGLVSESEFDGPADAFAQLDAEREQVRVAHEALSRARAALSAESRDAQGFPQVTRSRSGWETPDP